MKPDPDTEKPRPSIARSSSSRVVDGASSSKPTEAPKPSGFLWKDSEDLTQRDRVDIKQQAVLDGLRLGEKVSRILRSRTDGQNQDDGAQGLEDWAKRFESFIKELDKLFRNLKYKRDLRKRMEESPGDSELQEIEGQLDDIEATMSGTLETILLLFGLKEEDLNITSTEEFLNAHPLSVLGTMNEINETDRETFVNKVKPFMESKPEELAGGLLMLWPLIEHVTIFVKSDILKYGLELLDLPGIGDAVEARSRVAESFSQELDITAMVSSTIRAMEEKDVTGFIRKRQETEMKMNGKFDRNSLCVILSKSEDVDPNQYLRSKWIAKDYPFILGHVDRAKELDKRIRTSGSNNDTTASNSASEIEKAREELSSLRESLKQAAIYIRGGCVVERVQKDFRGRHAATKSVEDDPAQADTLEVFATSARSFQGIRHAGSLQEAGFPTEKHTGIPRLKQWLFEATMKKRENHLDKILNQMRILFSNIQDWISMGEHTAVLAEPEQRDLDAIHERHCRALVTLMRGVVKMMKQIKPLKAKAAAIAECQKEFPGIIDRWRYVFPENPNSFRKAFGNTQTCNLRKNGDYHQSKGKYACKYEWIDNLSSVFFNEQILSDWHHAFAVAVPNIEVEIQELLEHAWKRYMTALETFCAKHNAAHLRSTEKVQQVIENAEQYLGILAHAVLENMQNGAQDVHPRFRAEIQSRMTPAFEEACAIKGEGCVRKRDEVLKRFSDAHAKDLPVWAFEKMETALEDLMKQTYSSLEGIAAEAVSNVAKRIGES
ncbi:hypothetical protein KVR01_000870 [Diaporthe batatas]|uniref:uncharacterized protein n=1 Tax=Diaporthe batatas TaxID=748121 RepID=UPI001D04EFC3|nr:uncharacterized protein KVR01_000870 [Diaporthe batatas]KAG8170125.1 hypothetical protein KVR01_000870 [Diaporthe batatas]